MSVDFKELLGAKIYRKCRSFFCPPAQKLKKKMKKEFVSVGWIEELACYEIFWFGCIGISEEVNDIILVEAKHSLDVST